MSDIIKIERVIFGKNTFNNVVDVNFTELIPKDEIVSTTTSLTVNQFFDSYDTLFFDIPTTGENSHQELLNRSSEYLGISIEDMEKEIISLREENVSLKNQLFNLSNNTTT